MHVDFYAFRRARKGICMIVLVYGGLVIINGSKCIMRIITKMLSRF